MDGQTNTRWQQIPCWHSVAQVKIPFKKACNGWVTVKVSHGHQCCCHLISHISFPNLLMVHSNSISILHHFRDNTLFGVGACLWPWEVLIRQLELQASFAFQLMYKRIIVNACYISWCLGARKILGSKNDTRGHSSHCCWCLLIGHIQFPISLTLHIFPYLVPFLRYYELCPKI